MTARGLRGAFVVAAVAAYACSGVAAAAHTMVTPYDLPIPFSAYVFACAATLLLTFAVLVLVATEPVAARGDSPSIGVGHGICAIARVTAVFLLGLTVTAGLFGTPSPVANIGPTLFWVGLLVILTAVTALAGDFFQIINPWRVLLEWCRIGVRPRHAYPPWLSYWPAFAFYLALAWLELIAPPRPSLLATSLIFYTGATAAGAALFGRDAWLERAELFGVFFRTVGRIAPLAYRRTHDGARPGWRVLHRPPFSGALEDVPPDMSMVVFVLFMLAVTTYDGVWQTSFWAGLYWGNLMQWLRPLWGDDMARAQAILGPGYVVYQRGGLVAAPFVYLAIYMAVMAMIRMAIGGRLTTRALALRFAFSLVPIAVAYNIAHAWTLLLTVIPVLPFLLGDPFGFGWNPFGLPLMSAEPGSLQMGGVWHVEIALILAGHVASVYIARRAAVRVCTRPQEAGLAELPLVLLMVCYTFLGLVVLSLPLALH